MGRKYYGIFYVANLYNGKKSTGFVLSYDHAIDLAKALLKASKKKKNVDITIHKREGEKGNPGTVTIK